MGTAAGLLTDERLDLQAMVRQPAQERYAPHAQQWGRDRTFFPHEERRYLGELGLLGVTLPEESGGGGRPLMDALVVLEELAKASPLAARPTCEASAGPARVIHLFGTDEQKARLLPPVAAGNATIAVSVSEPGAGSAATDVSTRAVAHSDEIVINGAKRRWSGAGHAEQCLVYVRLGPQPGGKGIGAVIVDKDSLGLAFGPQEELMGHRGVGSADMFFDDVRVLVDNLIIGKGWLQQALHGVLDRAAGQRHSFAGDGTGMPRPHGRLRAGAAAVREGHRRVPDGAGIRGRQGDPGRGCTAADPPRAHEGRWRVGRRTSSACASRPITWAPIRPASVNPPQPFNERCGHRT